MTNYRKVAPHLGEQHAGIAKFRCKDCRGRAYADAGRVRVRHSNDCVIFLRLLLTHPRFYPTLEMYRSNAN